MNIELLKNVLSIPTYYGEESRIREFLLEIAPKLNCKATVDKVGNVYFTKGDSNNFPCVAAHMDSVFQDHIPLIKNNIRKNIVQTGDILKAYFPDTNKQTGLAGDDLCGVFICLEIIKNTTNIKASFFVQEEFGCQGSNNTDDAFFSNVGYVIQFDAPRDNILTETLMGKYLFSDKINDTLVPILEKYGITDYDKGPYTDVLSLRKKYDFDCLNFSAGYYSQHTSMEYVSISAVEKIINLGTECINILGEDKWTFSEPLERIEEDKRRHEEEMKVWKAKRGNIGRFDEFDDDILDKEDN